MLNIGVHRCRAVVGSLVMASTLICAMLPFAHDGIQVHSFQSTKVNAAEQKQLLDKYNSISGSLTVLLMKPIDVFLSMLVAVAVGYLLNTGFSALNMQVVPGEIHPTILSSDLVVENDYEDTQPLDADGIMITTSDSKFREDTPSNSVLNTIMRTLLVPTEEVPTWCNHVEDYPHQFKNIIASYGFPARSWQQRALSSALEPTATLTIPMNSETSELPSDEDLPMNVSIATNLAVYALVVSNTFLGWWGSGDEVWGQHSWGYSSINRSVPLLMAEYLNLTTEPSATSTFVKNLHNVSVDYFNKAENTSTTHKSAKLEFSHIDISDTVMFDALTIEIPLQMIGEQEDNSSSSNPFYRSMYDSYCNREACLIPDMMEYKENGNITTIYPRVQALAICLNEDGSEDLTVDFDYYRADEILQSCDHRSNSSMIIVSVGKRIEGGAFEKNPTTDHSPGRVVNAHMVYSLTVGRLSWTVENLASVYDANCASDDGCHGIRFPLEKAENTSTTDLLLVSDSGIPMSLLNPINMNLEWLKGLTHWKILASTVEETRGAGMTAEARSELIVLPRNFDRMNTSLTEYMNETGLEYCEIVIDEYIHHVEKNHLYIERTLQPAYTAGLYFVFQNAVVVSQLSSNATKLSLEFSGNMQDMYIQASIPSTSILLAASGCILLVFGGVIIALLGKHGEGALLEHGTAVTAAEAIANRDKFPPMLLRMTLRDRATGELLDASIDSLCVENVVLVNKTDKSQQFVVRGSLFSPPGVDQVKPYQTSVMIEDESCHAKVRSTEEIV
ncbi:Hypothetical protein PHPALM_3288 [Phytophthora palmivora]|uniref:Transmembrane protein n=1 Tax=Phytophthora palmivora TaxID=4796 RepID=A0A2P4YMR5_9STRA|nr:Hypothetical protein PHPALM_3288 [Phytophthora palmivora]